MRRVAAFTVRMRERVCSLRSSAAVALLLSDWDTSAPFCEYSTLTLGAHATSPLSGFLTPECVPLSLTVYSSNPAWGANARDSSRFSKYGRQLGQETNVNSTAGYGALMVAFWELAIRAVVA